MSDFLERLLPTMGVGSYASPSWLFAARKEIRAGNFGELDIEETFADSVRIAVWDQLEAGLDVISDGEIRRQRFVWDVYDRFEGLRAVAGRRKVGLPGYDRAPEFHTTAPLAAPQGLGLTEEYGFVRTLTDKPVKVACPGPLTLMGNIVAAAGYDGDKQHLARDLATMINTELRALVTAGADFVQLDEPGIAAGVLPVAQMVDLLNQCFEGVDVLCALHICFGNNIGRPARKRTYKGLFPALFDTPVRLFALEFANREMAEAELWKPFGRTHHLAAGVVDVKSYYQETPEDVAERIRHLLQFVDPNNLSLTADCGFSATPRWLARHKLQALVAGAGLIRQEFND